MGCLGAEVPKHVSHDYPQVVAHGHHHLSTTSRVHHQSTTTRHNSRARHPGTTPEPPGGSPWDERPPVSPGERKKLSSPWDETRRPYIIQAFQHRKMSLKLIVVAAHFPHPREYKRNIWKLRDALQRLISSVGIDNVILIADTNHPEEGPSNDEILEDIGAPFTGQVMSTRPFRSCCYPEFSINGYDRIIANFGASMQDFHPLSKGDVLKWGQRNMHLPVLGTLRLPATLAGHC